MLVVNGTTLPRVTVRLPPFALPALSTAIRYWPGKFRSLVPRPVLSNGMTAIVNFDSSAVLLTVASTNTVYVPAASWFCRFGVKLAIPVVSEKSAGIVSRALCSGVASFTVIVSGPDATGCTVG